MKKGIIIGVTILGALAAASWYIRKQDPRNAVARKLKSNSEYSKDSKGNIVVSFNQRRSVFYDNGRFFVFNEKGQWIYKGNYEKGGSVLIITETAPVAKLPKGTYESKKAYTNILKLME